MKIYFIDGKKVDLDSSEWNMIYSDGRWKSRGVRLFWRKKDDSFIIEHWSAWQGEHNRADVIIRVEAIDYLVNEEHHPERVHDALEAIKADVSVF